jgi:GTPase SAR1 family protein
MRITVYDVANRQSFDALPKWYSELETYVSPSVVKILVGNKVDKASTFVVPLTCSCSALAAFQPRV